MIDQEKIRLQVLRADLRKEEKLRKQREELEARIGNKPVIIRGHNWTLTLDEYCEQESWRRKSPDDGKVGDDYEIES